MFKKLNIVTKKQIYILLMISAFVLSSLIAFLYYSNNSLLKFEIVSKKKIINKNPLSTYIDLNNNGLTEKVITGADNDSLNFYLTINDDNNRIIRQYNFNSPLKSEWLHFGDFNNDNKKDLFIFYQKADSLFFSVIDIFNDEYFLKDLLILEKPDSARKYYWDINIIIGGLVSPNQFIFAVAGAFSLYPRTIYSFNLETQSITNKFPTSASINQIYLVDLYNNNKKEIIAASVPTGNINNPEGYDDQKSWLFILDQNLNPLITPMNFGTYGAIFFVKPYKYKKKYFLSVVSGAKNIESNFDEIYCIDSNGEILHKKEVDKQINNHIIIDDEEGKPNIILATRTGNILMYDRFLNLIRNVDTDYKELNFIKVLNLSQINENLILAYNYDQIILFNYRFKELANLKLNDILIDKNYNFSIKKTSLNTAEQLLIISKKNEFGINISSNFLYKYLPIIFIVVTLLFFFILLFFHRILSLLSTYIAFFRHQLNQSQNGIIILNEEGILKYSNKKMDEVLRIKSNFSKGNSYKEIFSSTEDIVAKISESIRTKNIIVDNFSYNLPNRMFNGELIITPFSSIIGYTYAYLIQIIDHTQPITSDRMKTWGSTIQRIAHEIKTPLSGINLGLDTLEKRLSKETKDFSEEIILIQNEVERIRKLTKNFLLFSNLEKPIFNEIEIDLLIENSLSIFQNYFNSGINIAFEKSENKILGDFSQLVQLFHIVLENSIDACGGKGKLEIRSGIVDVKDGMGTYKYICITIADDGKGISEQEISKIFEPYFSTKKDGTGIGLAIAKKIVEDHKGKIEIESKLGIGTEVHIYMPIIE